MAGKDVKVFIIAKDKNYSNDFMINYDILRKILDEQKITLICNESQIDDEVKLNINKYDIVIDGLFGVGLSRDIEGIFQKIIYTINKNANKIISIDAPSHIHLK